MSASEVSAPFREAMPGDISSYDVEGDLTSLEYCAVELDTVRARTVKAFAGGIPVGVLCNRPIQNASNTQFSTIALVQYKGKVLLKAGSGGLAVGDLVKITAGGVGITATPEDGDYVVGQCEVAAVEGLAATVRWQPAYARIP